MWKPLIQRSGDDWIGVTDQPGIWVGGVGGPRSVVNMANPVWLWPLLERNFQSVHEELEEAWSEISESAGLGEVEVDEFICLVIASALSSRREYWMSLALDWVDKMGEGGLRTKESVRSAIVQASQDEGISQSLSHRLRKMAKTIRRGD